MTVVPESSSESFTIRDVIQAIVLESEIKKIHETGVVSAIEQNIFENSLKATLRRLWKDDVTAQLLGSDSDEYTDVDVDNGDDVYYCPVHTADATKLSSCVASAV